MFNRKDTFYPLCVVALICATLWTLQSWWRWATFSYTTFDLAFYVQALEGFSRGEAWSSLLGVSAFGNHADFIILLIVPFHALFRHPMVSVVVQSLALGLSIPLAGKIAAHYGWRAKGQLALASLLVLHPVLTFVAIHEFHPEAFALPLWLAIYLAWQKRNLTWFWICTILLLACKENLALMVGAWCVATWFDPRNRRPLLAWHVTPLVVSALWMGLYLFWLAPMWNHGNVDFGALYSPLKEHGLGRGSLEALGKSWHGAIVWSLILPFLFLPVLRPFTLFAVLPIYAQHLLSWRESEWSIRLHYAAPLLPFFWVAAVEAVSGWKNLRVRKSLVVAMLVAHIICLGGSGLLEEFFQPWGTSPHSDSVQAKRQAIAGIPPEASVIAPVPYLSHLAPREKIYSLHLVLKGLKVLSKTPYSPPAPTDVVIGDYSDAFTFDPSSGYYHPAMQMRNGKIISSSDILVHDVLRQAEWKVSSINSITVFRKKEPLVGPANSPLSGMPSLRSGCLDAQTDLLTMTFHKSDKGESAYQLDTQWLFRGERKIIPWLTLFGRHRGTGETYRLERGLCAPEGIANGEAWTDSWTVRFPTSIHFADYEWFAVFEDRAYRSYLIDKRKPLAEDDRRVILPLPLLRP